MPETKADLLLHPIRLRILMALAGRQMTPQQLVASLKDVPQATLYRHLNRLVKAEVLRAVEERPVRGTVEKVYALNQATAQLTEADLARASQDDHLHYFIVFAATLIGDFARYLQAAEPLVLRRVGYHKAPVYLSDEELKELSQKLNTALGPFLANSAGAERQRMLFSTVLMPDADEKTA